MAKYKNTGKPFFHKIGDTYVKWEKDEIKELKESDEKHNTRTKYFITKGILVKTNDSKVVLPKKEEKVEPKKESETKVLTEKKEEKKEESNNTFNPFSKKEKSNYDEIKI